MTKEHTVVLVHGAWHGAWCFSKFEKVLVERGVHSTAVDLTSQGYNAASIGDLSSDVELLRKTIASLPGPVVVLAHSAYGGMVTSEAADGLDNISRLIFLSSFAPYPGESLSSIFGGQDRLPPFVEASGGLLTVKTGWGRRLFYTNSTTEVALEAEHRLMPQSAVTFDQEVKAAAWRTIPSSYIICTEDQAMPAQGQMRMAARVKDFVELRSDHCPFLSQPDALADLLDERS